MLNGISCLREAIISVPIPGAPPRLSKDGAAVGLAFLETVLRQNHVRRLTERLTLIEHRAARCTTEVDISLGLLDDGQREAGLLYQRLRNRGDTQVRDWRGLGDEPPATAGDVIWVPISRVARRGHAPIDVVNGEGAKLPRLTQYETSRLIASALYRLLRAILSTHPDAHERSPLNDFLFRTDKPRWLVQAALLALLTERSKPAIELERRPGTPQTVHGEGARNRTAALQVLEDYKETLREYVTLLDIAVNEYLLVVALNSGHDEHLLAFDSPLHVEPQPQGHSIWRPLRLAGGAYWVAYNTRLPASLRAYHLVAETEPGLQIETMYLASNAESGIVTALHADLKTLATRVENEQSQPTDRSGQKLLELELQTCLRRLSELLRRRRWEAGQARLNLNDSDLPSTSALAWAVTSGEAVRSGSGEVTNSLFRHPLVTAQNLTAAADEIAQHQLYLDLSLEDDPASDYAHVYWRRDPARMDVEQSISIRSSMFIRDTGGSRPGSVIAYVAGVVVVSYVLGSLMFGSPFPYVGHGALERSSADAIIAVLLLVPGFLYTRLNLPVRRSIAGQLQVLPRFVAQVTIGCAALLAAAIAASQDDRLVRAALALCATVPVAAVLLMLVMSRVTRSDLMLIDANLPSWARTSVSSSIAVRARWIWPVGLLLSDRRLRELYPLPDAVFRASGSQS
jgi:hypothetical protein